MLFYFIFRLQNLSDYGVSLMVLMALGKKHALKIWPSIKEVTHFGGEGDLPKSDVTP